MRPRLTPVEAAPVFTVAHSKRSTEAFVALLEAGRVDLVVDAGIYPFSNRRSDDGAAIWQLRTQVTLIF